MKYLKIIVSLFYVAILVVLGVATFLENEHGVAWAHLHIYAAWWFSALWGSLAILGIIYFIKVHERRWSVIILHASLVLILIGALLSHITGRSGTIHLRLNQPQDIIEISHHGINYLHRLQYEVTLTKFEILADAAGNPIDYRSDIKIGSIDASVSMNKIFKHGNLRFYQMSYDDDIQGSTLAINRDPYGIPITYCGYLLLFSSLITLCLKRFVSVRLWLIVIVLSLAWCFYYFVLDGSWVYIPVLRSPLLFVHVVTIIMAYALLLVQAVLSSVWLLRKHNNPTTYLPKGSVGMLRLCLCFLAMGIFLGAIWANISWGNYWSWDSKEVWALITFMVYAVPAHRRSFPIFNKPKVYHCYMLFAFSVVLMTYLGVNYCLMGMHSYT